MDFTARGAAMAALTLHFGLLEQLVRWRTLTPAQAMEIANKSLEAVPGGFDDEDIAEVSEAARVCLMNLREDLAEMIAAEKRTPVN